MSRALHSLELKGLVLLVRMNSCNAQDPRRHPVGTIHPADQANRGIGIGFAR